MTLHHRIWELVKMISLRHGQGAEDSGKLADESQSGETIFSGRGPEETVAAASQSNHEAEISRLTWAVIDGKASPAERLRLAELVSAHHDTKKA